MIRGKCKKEIRGSLLPSALKLALTRAQGRGAGSACRGRRGGCGAWAGTG
jgi:hypothetical protein